jgi:predicted DNA-binding transcriptional regulator AlpA
MQKTGLPRSSIYAKMNPLSSAFDPSFPVPVKLSPGPRGAVAWKLHEVEEWMKTRPTISRNLVKKGSVENHDNP